MKVLAWWTVALTYCLMVWGNTVSATGSGLACPDWPTCHGTLLPPIRVDIVLEWGHRLLAALATAFILLTILKGWKEIRKTASLKKPLLFLVSFIGIQILLGAITVLLKLSVIVSSIHLVLATLLFSALIAVAVATTYEPIPWEGLSNPAATKKLRALSVATLGALLLQFALGALVRHSGAGLACPLFPYCMDGILPSPITIQNALHFCHRWIGILLLVGFIQIRFAARSFSSSKGVSLWSAAVLLLAVLQATLGIWTVLSGLSTLVRATHAAIGYALWGITFFGVLRTGGLSWIWKKA